jgi:ubiquinone/menaquinone biosynthesis C-methylase UbiE
LVFNNVKDDYEIGQIKNKTTPSSKSVILDVGCGTGHHVGKMATTVNGSLDIIGIDISPSMISKAKLNYPDYNFMVGNVLDYDQFQPNTFTHILCLYFTLYYFENKQKFFNNCMEWLMPGGTLIVHVVNREKFDPILPPGNPLYIVSPQKYAKKRITSTKITFNEFVYSSDFDLDTPNNIATFHEKFKFNDGKVRKQEHKLYMESETDIITMAQDAGFLIHGKIDLLECAYEYQYLYILIKPQ